MSTPMKKRPIGSFFVEKGFVTQEQLEDALRAQRESGQRLGEILVERGHISRFDLASVIGSQLGELRLLQGGLAQSKPEPAHELARAREARDETAELERRLANQAETIDQLLDQVNDLNAALARAAAQLREAEPAAGEGLVVVDE
jgi:methyl-accepting chemotaxis protein